MEKSIQGQALKGVDEHYDEREQHIDEEGEVDEFAECLCGEPEVEEEEGGLDDEVHERVHYLFGEEALPVC